MAGFKTSRGKKIRNGRYYSDLEMPIANKGGYYLQFTHVPTGHVAQFKAMLKSYSENYDSEWNDVSVFGRNDKIQTFRGTTRTINLSFVVLAESAAVAKDNLHEISLLASMLYPVYDEEGGQNSATSISASPLIRLLFANLIKDYSDSQNDRIDRPPSFTTKIGTSSLSSIGLLGSIRGFSFTPNLDEGLFGQDGEVVEHGELFPQSITISFSFHVIHTTKLGWNKEGVLRTPKFPYGENQIFEEESKEGILEGAVGINQDLFQPQTGQTDEQLLASMQEITEGTK